MKEKGSSYLVETDWLAERLGDSSVCVVEVDWNPADAYDYGHIPGALNWKWKEDLWHPTDREFIEGHAFCALMGQSGISNDTTVILYGDSNRFATYAFFVLKLRGHTDVRLLHGGRTKWITEGRSLTDKVLSPKWVEYKAGEPEPWLRATWGDILAGLPESSHFLLDVRSIEEYRGERVAPPGMPDHGAECAGRIPGAFHLHWAELVREDDSFLPLEDLRARLESIGATPDKDIIIYCRMSHRASLAWFVLKYLLEYPFVRSYDGSWTEWGSMMGMPIEK